MLTPGPRSPKIRLALLGRHEGLGRAAWNGGMERVKGKMGGPVDSLVEGRGWRQDLSFGPNPNPQPQPRWL